jgi:hypothetical protein
VQSATAAFDSLFIASRVEQLADPPTDGELHLFAYLACLLSLLRGAPASDWGYTFSATHEAAPFSTALIDASDLLVSAGWLHAAPDGVTLSSQGRSELEALAGLTINRRRVVYLEAACSTVLALPLPVLRDAISLEPQLNTAIALAATRPLMTDASIPALHAQFQALETATSATGDLMIPAVIWLSYLAATEEPGSPADAAVRS